MALPELTTELLTACSLSPEPSSTAEVIVVGASLGGLQAAYDIQQSGLSCLVIDTKESISYSNGTGAGSCDVGELVHIFGQPRTCELARRLGLKLERRDVSGRNMIEGLGVSGVADLPNVSIPTDVYCHRSWVATNMPFCSWKKMTVDHISECEIMLKHSASESTSTGQRSCVPTTVQCQSTNLSCRKVQRR